MIFPFLSLVARVRLGQARRARHGAAGRVSCGLACGQGARIARLPRVTPCRPCIGRRAARIPFAIHYQRLIELLMRYKFTLPRLVISVGRSLLCRRARRAWNGDAAMCTRLGVCGSALGSAATGATASSRVIGWSVGRRRVAWADYIRSSVTGMVARLRHVWPQSLEKRCSLCRMPQDFFGTSPRFVQRMVN